MAVEGAPNHFIEPRHWRRFRRQFPIVFLLFTPMWLHSIAGPTALKWLLIWVWPFGVGAAMAFYMMDWVPSQRPLQWFFPRAFRVFSHPLWWSAAPKALAASLIFLALGLQVESAVVWIFAGYGIGYGASVWLGYGHNEGTQGALRPKLALRGSPMKSKVLWATLGVGLIAVAAGFWVVGVAPFFYGIWMLGELPSLGLAADATSRGTQGS